MGMHLLSYDGHLLSYDGHLLDNDGHLLGNDGHLLSNDGHSLAIDEQHLILPFPLIFLNGNAKSFEVNLPTVHFPPYEPS